MSEAHISAESPLPTPQEAELVARAVLVRQGSPMSVAAFKREVRPGRRLVCVYRSHGGGRLNPGVQPFSPVQVLSVHSTHVRLSIPMNDDVASYLDYPTKRNASCLEEIAGGFILRFGERRNVYCWLPDTTAQAAS